MTIESGDLRRIPGDSTSSPPNLQAGQYAIDYGSDPSTTIWMAFPVNDPNNTSSRVYSVSLSVWASNGTAAPVLFSVLDQPITVPAGDKGSWIKVFDPSDPNSPIQIALPPGYSVVEIDNFSDTCARAFVEQSGNWDPNNPYEYKLADPILGVIAFNPTGNGTYEQTAQGLTPIRARIDYRIFDTRIIREDRTIPDPDPNAAAGAPIPVKLSLRFILSSGDATDNPNEPTYQNLFDGALVNTTPGDALMAVDLDTGCRVDPNVLNTPGCIDYIDGVVNLPQVCNLVDYDGNVVQSNVQLAGRQIRFFYRADGDWTVQCQKAYSLYTADRTGDYAPDYRHYIQGPDANGNTPNRLWFAQSEAEKTVSCDYTYLVTLASGSVVQQKVVGELHQISSTTDNPPYNQACYVDLSVPVDSNNNPWPLGQVTVVGTSFRVRVIWRDGTVWRDVDLDTNLVQTSQ